MDAAHVRDDMVAMAQHTIDAAGGDWNPLSKKPASSECSTAEGSADVTLAWDQERAGTQDSE